MPADSHHPRSYTLVGPDGQAHCSALPGTLGDHRGGRIYGRLDCCAALQALANGGYVTNRVFFADEATAVAAGYRPCGVCLPTHHTTWASLQHTDVVPAAARLAYTAARALEDRFGPFDELGSVVLGHSRDQTTHDATRILRDHLVARGVEVHDVVDWPEQAASWLRQATRFTASAPDLWVVVISDDNGWVRMQHRLADTDWDSDRTLVVTARR